MKKFVITLLVVLSTLAAACPMQAVVDPEAKDAWKDVVKVVGGWVVVERIATNIGGWDQLRAALDTVTRTPVGAQRPPAAEIALTQLVAAIGGWNEVNTIVGSIYNIMPTPSEENLRKAVRILLDSNAIQPEETATPSSGPACPAGTAGTAAEQPWWKQLLSAGTHVAKEAASAKKGEGSTDFFKQLLEEVGARAEGRPAKTLGQKRSEKEEKEFEKMLKVLDKINPRQLQQGFMVVPRSTPPYYEIQTIPASCMPPGYPAAGYVPAPAYGYPAGYMPAPAAGYPPPMYGYPAAPQPFYPPPKPGK